MGLSLEWIELIRCTERELTYSWSFAQVPNDSSLSTVTDPTTVAPSFTPDSSGLYLIALVVNNGLLDSEPDTVVVRVSATASDIPVAVAGADITAEDCTNVTLDGSASYDPNEQPLTYLWDLETRPADSNATVDTFADRESGSTTFYPDTEGPYTVSLSVYDGSGWSVPDHLTITATERSTTASRGQPGLGRTFEGGTMPCSESAYSYFCDYYDSQTITIGTDAVISDPDSDTLTYSWRGLSDGIAIHSANSLETAVVLSGAQPVEPGLCGHRIYH